jgi:uncharacterized membrane protein
MISASGLLFLAIIVLNLVSDKFGHETYSNLNSEIKLQSISNDPKKFKISVFLIVLEHICIIILAISLFIVFGQYNLILGVIWMISRIMEGLIQIYNKRDYWSLHDLAKKYSQISDLEKETLIESGRKILKSKNFNFSISQILFSIGTFAYSTLFAIYGVVPAIIGWFGIIASILYGLGNYIRFLKSGSNLIWNIGGLLVLLFEIILGVWLLFFSWIFP